MVLRPFIVLFFPPSLSRRRELKEAVFKLRNQLRNRTKKPSTISVLKAAREEILVLYYLD